MAKKKFKCLGCSGDSEGWPTLCDQCRADLELGRLVRAMPEKFALVHHTNGEWAVSKYGTVNDEEPDEWRGDKPEEALKKAREVL